MREATAWHGQGRLSAAEAAYRAVLERAPDHFDALHLLGVIHYQNGQADTAVELIQRALQVQPAGSAAAYSNLGLAHQALRQYPAALQDFEQALALDPHHLEALNNRGNTLNQLGRSGEALATFERLLALKPDAVEALTNCGVALQQLGRIDDALASHRRALQLRPAYPKALNNLGHVLHQAGRHREALDSFEQALALHPEFVEALDNRAVALRALGQADAALASVEHALQLAPGYVAALNHRGNLLRELQRPDEALASYQQALQLAPDDAEAWSNRAGALCDLQRPEQALLSCAQALQLRPGSVEAWVNRANALRDLRRPEQALLSCEQALRLAPDLPAALLNRGNALLDLNRAQAALDSYDAALRLAPPDAASLTNRSLALQQLGRYQEALAGFEQAVQQQPDYAQAHWYASLCQLLLGDFAAGWARYEWRWQVPGLRARRRDFGVPQWLGDTPLQGKTILLHAEQGLGDTLQFCRYTQAVAARGARVILEVQAALQPLLAQLGAWAQVVSAGQPLPPFDCHCPLMSLPLAFHTELATLPAAIPYLQADPARVAHWRQRLAHSRQPLIGLIWSGNPQHINDRNRSLALAQLAPWWHSKARFISLQNEVRETDRAALEHAGIADFSQDLHDFADTAALLACVDQVITVDTSGAHLAGALGKPTTLLLPQQPDFRWLLARTDTPWYPSMRLLRQTVPGDWSGAIAEVAARLAAL